MMKLAFLGFRHGHVMGLYQSALEHPDVEVVAAVEEDPATVATLRAAGKVELTHERIAEVLASVPCDAVAIGDVYARRGAIAIAALEAGKHVIADKPLCTRLDELDRIAELSRANQRVVHCLFDLRDTGPYRTMCRLIGAGEIGTVHTVNFTAQHPLLLGTRPGWYFERGAHGGTINDIAIHAIDLIPWLTGRSITGVVAARAWNARLPQFPHFQDAAQIMLRLDNGGGVLGDLSYLAPDGVGYSAPQYWRVTCHGERGFVEARYGSRDVLIATYPDKTVRTISADDDIPHGRLVEFLDEVAGTSRDGALTTADVLTATRIALQAQQSATE
jgi:predicted dehydrogenase